MSKIYFYNSDNKEFSHEMEIIANMGESVPNSTLKKTMDTKTGYTVCFNEEKNIWEYKEDNRNKIVYSTSSKEALKIDYLGAIKTGFTLLIPKEFDKWDEPSKSWIEDIELKNEYEKAQAKEQKEKELNELIIDHNTVLYDANGEALGNMATVIAIANATFNRAISVGIVSGDSTKSNILSLEAAYTYVYKNQTVTWKGADNKPHKVQLESLVEASQKAMTEKSKILFKY